MSMPYVNFRGVSTASLNCYIVSMPSHKKAILRNTTYTIPGRDGTLHVNEGFDTFNIYLTLMLSGVSAANRQVINAWADGTGKLYTSDDPSKCYQASVYESIEWKRDMVGGVFYDTARITFTCQPFMRETVESVNTFTSNGTLVNIGDIETLPLIKVTGSGDCGLTIGGQTIELSGVQSAHPVFIDSEAGYVYTDSGNATMVGNFPTLGLGSTSVGLSGGTTRLDITPRWGWV